MYTVQERVLDCKDHGLPQSRRRLYIVGVRTKFLRGTFHWPKRIGLKKTTATLLPKKLPTLSAMGALSEFRLVKLLEATEKAIAKGYNLKKNTPAVFLDIDSGSNYATNVYRGTCPCITSTRAAAGGFWVPCRRQRLGTESMAHFQGIPLQSLKTDCISERQLRLMIGNAWAINVATRLMYQLVQCAGLATLDEIRDPWAEGGCAPPRG